MPVQPTQVTEPGKTTARTVVQTVLGIAIAAGIVIPVAVVIVQEELADWLPPEAVAVLATVSAAAVALSAIITRIMAIPQVNAWLAKVGLSAGAGTAYQAPVGSSVNPHVVEPYAQASPSENHPEGYAVETGADGIPDDPKRSA